VSLEQGLGQELRAQGERQQARAGQDGSAGQPDSERT
jgi:hypothetical protein